VFPDGYRPRLQLQEALDVRVLLIRLDGSRARRRDGAVAGGHARGRGEEQTDGRPVIHR
jgi:hypothetical protein